ncbi:hypothetical protein [Lysobacter gummosus]
MRARIRRCRNSSHTDVVGINAVTAIAISNIDRDGAPLRQVRDRRPP